MATKKKPGSKAKPAPRAPQQRLENLAARPSYDDILDEQLVDHSGVFRVTSSIAQAQTGHDEESTLRFASDSLVMAAQKDGFREDGPSLDDAADETTTEDETLRAERRRRLATLAARAQQLRNRSRR
jgi:hypothetical protein